MCIVNFISAVVVSPIFEFVTYCIPKKKKKIIVCGRGLRNPPLFFLFFFLQHEQSQRQG